MSGIMIVGRSITPYFIAKDGEVGGVESVRQIAEFRGSLNKKVPYSGGCKSIRPHPVSLVTLLPYYHQSRDHLAN
jgi:hypothetical protein